MRAAKNNRTSFEGKLYFSFNTGKDIKEAGIVFKQNLQFIKKKNPPFPCFYTNNTNYFMYTIFLSLEQII